MTYELLNGDCLKLMKSIPDNSVNLVLCDLPYGTTACSWDSVIPLEPLWDEYNRILVNNGSVVLTASQPFTNQLINSNPGMFRYELIWVKSRATNFVNAKNRPMKIHENILVFSKGNTNHEILSVNRMTYNPQGLYKLSKPIFRKKKNPHGVALPARPSLGDYTRDIAGYPDSVLYFESAEQNGIHPTQKPVDLFKYLTLTYSNEGDVVLDNTMGSGTTGVACMLTKRNFIGIEQDEGYFNTAKSRIIDALDRSTNILPMSNLFDE